MTPIRGRWTIRVCPDCGERVHDDATIHGCRPPGLYSYPAKTEVVPVPDEAAIERGALALRRVPRRAVNDKADDEQLREWARLVLRAALEPETP